MFKKKPVPPPSVRQRQPVHSNRSRSSLVFSYHASPRPVPAVATTGKQPKTAVARRNASANWVKRRPILVGMVALFLVVSNLILGVSPKVQVAGPNTDGHVFLRSPALYVQAAHDALASSVLNRNKITINTESVAKRLRTQFPELSDVSVSLPFIGTQPVVYVQPAAPRLLLATTSGNTYVLDDAGRALILANQAAHVSPLHLPTVIDQSGLPVRLGRLMLTSSSVSYITEVTGQLKAKGVNFTSLTLPKGGNELDIKINGQPYTVKFNLRGNARAEAGTYLAVAAQLAKEKKTPASYIDVRVDQRAYYQ